MAAAAATILADCAGCCAAMGSEGKRAVRRRWCWG